ncbi:MAG: sensor histidine kinase [Eubacteriales bacterium]|nr:sensor histidine kinase [Eubacteriales bacterium]
MAENSSVFYSLPVKVTAVILLFITACAAVSGWIAAIYMADSGYYTEEFSVIAGDRYQELIGKYPDDVDLKTGYKIETFMYRHKINIIILASAAILASVILFIYLLHACGRKRGVQGITLNIVDRVPLDLYAGIIAAILLLCVYLADSVIHSRYSTSEIVATLPLVIILYTILVSFIMTIAVRLKNGGILRNTLVFIMFKYILKGIIYAGKCIIRMIGMIRHIPLLWKILTGFLIYTVLNTIVIVALINGGGAGFLVWLVFNAMLLLLLCAIYLQFIALKKGGEQLAAGNSAYKIPTDRLIWDFRRHAENLNNIGRGLQLAVDERMKSERFKTELITNVSHDIKTPLTSIINYVDLIKKEKTQNEVAAGYIEALERQSLRLKKLTEDLIEVSKAATGNVAVKTGRSDIDELIGQCIAEYGERFTAAEINPIIELPDYPIFAQADGKLLWRIMDNLLGNICKYSLPGTRAYITARADDSTVYIILRNISREPLNLTPDELMERFVRSDTSRNTEGSGLGLTIARSLAELQGGTVSIETDGDLFKSTVMLPRAAE